MKKNLGLNIIKRQEQNGNLTYIILNEIFASILIYVIAVAVSLVFDRGILVAFYKIIGKIYRIYFSEIRKEYLQILIYINLFCGFTSRKVVFARGAHLNCEVRLTPRSSPVPDTLKLPKIANLRRNAARS